MSSAKPAVQPRTDAPVVSPDPINPTLALALTLYAYFLGSMFFAAIVPSVLILLVYVVVVESITWVTYYLLGWEWNPYIRLAIVVATVLGYAVGMATYKTANYLSKNAQSQNGSAV